MSKKPAASAQRQRTMSTRAYTRSPSTVDVEAARFGVIAATETPVRTWLCDPRMPDRYIEADEVLELSGLDLSRAAGMPLVDGHDVYGGIGKILGKIDNVRIEGEAVVADAELNSRNRDLIVDIARGHYAQVSIGYDYNAAADAVLEEREGDVPLVRVKRWTLTEISLVPVGADPNASVRAKRRNAFRSTKQETDMDELEQLIAAAEEAVTAAEEAIVAVEEAVEAAGEEVSDDLLERARKLRGKRDEDEDKKDDEARGKREDSEEDEKKEEEEVRAIRAIARDYGLAKRVDDLVKLGARAREIKAAVRAAIVGKAADPVAAPAAVKPVGRKSDDIIDTRSIYERRNRRS